MLLLLLLSLFVFFEKKCISYHNKNKCHNNNSERESFLMAYLKMTINRGTNPTLNCGN